MALAIAAAAVAVIFNAGPPAPNVRFVNFMPEGKQTIKENQEILVKFKVHNFESYDVPNARVTTTLQGDSRFFAIDNSDFIVTPAIGGPNGESRDLTIKIVGTNLGSQQAIEDKFSINLYVGADLTDRKQFDVRLEK